MALHFMTAIEYGRRLFLPYREGGLKGRMGSADGKLDQ